MDQDFIMPGALQRTRMLTSSNHVLLKYKIEIVFKNPNKLVSSVA